MGFLDNKKALIIGVASNRSIAWGVAQAMHAQGGQRRIRIITADIRGTGLKTESENNTNRKSYARTNRSSSLVARCSGLCRWTRQ